jgi:hypothetical protein
MENLPPETATGIDWAFAPDWLTIEEACFLSGHDRGTMLLGTSQTFPSSTMAALT